eukprot:gene11589-24258_t
MENIFVLWVYMVVATVLSLSFFIAYRICSSFRWCKESYLGDREVLHAILIAAFTFLWYAISVSFTIFNKWFLSEWEGGFEYPILCSTVHLSMKFVLTRLWVRCNGIHFEPVSFGVVTKIVIPIGIATAMDIMLSNVSLLHISVTLYTVVKASVVVWVFMWGVLFRLEKFRVVTFLSVLIASAGLGLAVSSHTTVSVTGLLLCLAAAASGGLRWALTQQLMVSDEYSKNVFVAIYRFSPAAALSMMPFALIFEVFPLAHSRFVHDPKALTQALLMTVTGGFIAFALILAEVNLVRLSSSLTMGMLGQMKEVLQITLALMIFRDELHPINALGIVISLVGSAFYRYIKSSEARDAVQLTGGYLPLQQVENVLDVFDDNMSSQDDSLSDNNDNDTPIYSSSSREKASGRASNRTTNGGNGIAMVKIS